MNGSASSLNSHEFSDRLSTLTLQSRRFHQPGTVEPLSGRTIKQDGIALGLPDSRHFHRPGAVQTEEDSAGTIAADQNAFRHAEGAKLELIEFTQDFIDIFA